MEETAPHRGPEASIDREGWNQRYREGQHTQQAPDPLLLHLYEEFIDPLFPLRGRGLDLAGGAGRHALWLAKQGWDMTLADLSDEATRLAARHAEEASVPLKTLSEPGIDTLDRAASSTAASFDFIMVVQYLDRALFPAIRRALRPGGLVFYKTHTLDHLALAESKPRDPNFMLERQELLRHFSGMRLLYFNETVARRGTQAILARMP